MSLETVQQTGTGNTSQSTVRQIEISVKGKWSTVPALDVDGKCFIVKGKWIKRAIVDAEEWLETEVQDPQLCAKELKKQQRGSLRADLFSFTQKLPEIDPKYDYPFEKISVAVVRVSSFGEWWDSLPQVTRKNVRRSQKRDVVVSVAPLDDKLVADIVDLNNDSAFRQNIPFAHYGKSFDQVKKDQSTYLDRSDFICAYSDNQLIGFLKLVYKGNVASILQILPRASQQDKRPGNALLAKAVELCEERGVTYLTYGLFNYGNKRDSSLREFKERNGFIEVLVPRFHVPLNMWGAFCIKTKLNRGLLGVLPPQVIAAATRMRTAWYDVKRGMSRRSSMPEQPNCNRQMERSNPPTGSNN